MLNRVLEICEENRYISLYRGFIVIKSGGIELGRVPLDDIAVMILSAQGITISKNVLNALAERGCITILCGKNYHPESMIIPEYSHYLFTKIIKNQINATLPFKKRIWQQVVILKIKNQAKVLKLYGFENEAAQIDKISYLVDSGDTKNRESYAARMYWHFLFGKEFIRDKNGDGINSLLNYGYAIMRAGMARAICSAGLIPALGIHHDNNTNQFCLVDDLFEIYRPIVDALVFKLIQEEETELTVQTKKILANVLKIKVHTVEGLSPAATSMRYLAASFVKALDERKPVIELPVWKGDEDGITIIE